jgi:hypothetical protein
MPLDNRKNDKKIDDLRQHIDDKFFDVKENMRDIKHSIMKQEDKINNLEKENFGLKTTLNNQLIRAKLDTILVLENDSKNTKQ